MDYKEPEAISTIHTLAGDSGLSLILDCVASNDTAAFCYQCFVAPKEPADIPLTYRYASLMPVEPLPPRPKILPESSTIVHKMNMVYTCFGRRFNLLDQTWEPSAKDRNFMVMFYERIGSILATGKLHLMPIEVREGWLGAIPKGITDIREGKVRGKKLVYLPTDPSSAEIA